MKSRIFAPALLAAMSFGAEIPTQTAALGKQMASMEEALDRHFRSAGAGSSIAMIGAARSVYLPEYGALFLVEVNLAPVANVSPFRRSYSEAEKQQLNIRKRERMDELERTMREALMQESAGLTEIGEDERIALAVSLFHFPWEDLTQLPKQVVMVGARGELAAGENLIKRYY